MATRKVVVSRGKKSQVSFEDIEPSRIILGEFHKYNRGFRGGWAQVLYDYHKGKDPYPLYISVPPLSEYAIPCRGLRSRQFDGSDKCTYEMEFVLELDNENQKLFYRTIKHISKTLRSEIADKFGIKKKPEFMVSCISPKSLGGRRVNIYTRALTNSKTKYPLAIKGYSEGKKMSIDEVEELKDSAISPTFGLSIYTTDFSTWYLRITVMSFVLIEPIVFLEGGEDETDGNDENDEEDFA